MPRGPAAKGHCYICGAQLTSGAMKNHILKNHRSGEETPDPSAVLIKVEAKYSKRYWLYLEAPISACLEDLDHFMRNIWLECCGHLSAFTSNREELPMDWPLVRFPEGTVLTHDYDFGSTTTCLVTFLGRISGPSLDTIHLLARNDPEELKCSVCGQPAEWIDTDSSWQDLDDLYCTACLHKKFGAYYDMCLPVTNSPRMGVCGYCGDRDHYGYTGPEEPQPEKKPRASRKKSAET